MLEFRFIRIAPLFIILSLLFIAGCDESSETEPESVRNPVLYVGNQAGGAGSLSFVDIQTEAVVRNAGDLTGSPSDFYLRDKMLYVINYTSHSLVIFTLNDDNTVSKDTTIDLGAARLIGPKHITGVEGGMIYISNYNAGNVSVFNPDTRRVEIDIRVGLSPTDLVHVNGKIYVCNSGYNPTTQNYEPAAISVIPTGTNRVEKDIQIDGLNPRAMAVDSQNRIHILCRNDGAANGGEVFVIDSGTDTRVDYTRLGGSPEDIAITKAGIAYVAAGGWGTDPGYIYRYNASDGYPLNGPENPIETGTGASRIIAYSDSTVFVSCKDANKVEKIVGTNRASSYPVGENPVPLIVR